MHYLLGIAYTITTSPEGMLVSQYNRSTVSSLKNSLHSYRPISTSCLSQKYFDLSGTLGHVVNLETKEAVALKYIVNRTGFILF